MPKDLREQDVRGRAYRDRIHSVSLGKVLVSRRLTAGIFNESLMDVFEETMGKYSWRVSVEGARVAVFG